jgi:1A family penicillin-binding protein
MLFRIFKWLVYSGFTIMVIGIITVVVMLYQIIPSIPRLPDDLNDIFGQTTKVYAYDQGGNPFLIHTLGGHRRVPFDQIAVDFQHAIVATEDANFFNHHGVDKPGIIRAFTTNLRDGQIVGQGASTITQQLARHLFFTKEKQWIRKIREAMASMQIEEHYSKEEILSAYCNNVYYGANAYGVEEAAQRFFSKHAIDLSLGEATLLAGLVQRPSPYNPYYYMERALKRRETVLQRMVANHYITEEQAAQARAEKITLKGTSIGPSHGPYFLDYVEEVMLKKYRSNLVYNGGLRVFVTMDMEMQKIAEEAVRTKLAALDSLVKDPVYNTASREERVQSLEAALVSIDTRTGAVKTLVGGRDYTTSEYNRAVQSNRQPGSGFKPIIYLSAIDRLGYSPNTVVVDEPVAYTTDIGDVWEPQNFNRAHEGPIVLKRALMRSVNVISAKLINEVGPQVVVDYAQRLGVTSKLDPVLSLALGTNGVSPLDMASVYSVFPTGGVYHPPYVIARVEDSEGRVLEEAQVEHRRVVSEQSAYLMLDMLRGVILAGTGASIPIRYGFTTPAGGKTGTSSDSKDVWFNGFTHDLATSVWIGYDDSRPLKPIMGRETTGASGAIPVWVEFMKHATDLLTLRAEEASKSATDLPQELLEEAERVARFPIPLGIEAQLVDLRTGSTPGNPDSTLFVAIRGATPKQKPE